MQVHDVDMMTILDGFEHTEQRRFQAACKEALQAIKDRSLVAVFVLRIKARVSQPSHTGGSQLDSKPSCHEAPAILVPSALAKASLDLSLSSAN